MGENALAAINLALPILSFYLGVELCVGVGGTAICGSLLGARDKNKADQVISQQSLRPHGWQIVHGRTGSHGLSIDEREKSENLIAVEELGSLMIGQYLIYRNVGEDGYTDTWRSIFVYLLPSIAAAGLWVSALWLRSYRVCR